MDAGVDDGELDFTAVNAEPNKQSNDPPLEFSGTKPSEFKKYREKVRRWLLFTRTPAQSQGPKGCGHFRWSERDPGNAGGSLPG